MSVENQTGPLPMAGAARAGSAAPIIDRPTRIALICLAGYLSFVALGWYLAEGWLPDAVSVTFFGHLFSVGDLHHHLFAVGAFGVLVVPALFGLELAVVGWHNSSMHHFLMRRSASSLSDLVVFVIGQVHILNLLRILLTFGAALVSGAWLHDRIASATGIDLSLQGLPTPMQYATYFLLYTFFDYWNHRADHSALFWPLHRYHHSAEELYILTSSRVHPAIFTSILVTNLPLALIDTPPVVIFWLNFFIAAERFLIHSRIDSDFGWFGRYFLQSPADHRMHHILDATQPAANYSLFPLWDHLFGTWRGGGSRQIVIGVADRYRHGAWVIPDMWRDYREFFAELIRKAAPGR